MGGKLQLLNNIIYKMNYIKEKLYSLLLYSKQLNKSTILK